MMLILTKQCQPQAAFISTTTMLTFYTSVRLSSRMQFDWIYRYQTASSNLHIF